jgi:hypothetical protein
MTWTGPVEAGGLVVIRLWVEPGPNDPADDALRARITTARNPDLSSEETVTVAGADGVLAVVRDFLIDLAGDQPPSRRPGPA